MKQTIIALVETIERETIVYRFKTREEAKEKMLELFKEAARFDDWHEESQKDFNRQMENGHYESFTGDYGFYEDGAWVNSNNPGNCDWTIATLTLDD